MFDTPIDPRRRAELGIPPDAIAGSEPLDAATWSGEKAAGYSFDIVGVRVPPETHTAAPIFRVTFDPAPPALWLLYSQAVHHASTDVWGEKRWHPDAGLSLHLHAPDLRAMNNDGVSIIRRGLHLIEKALHEPPGPKPKGQAAELAALLEVVRKPQYRLYDLSRPRIAQWTADSVSNVKHRLARAKTTLQELERLRKQSG